uniref:Uncharacterized protein n=1 Tax=Rhizophora mucronata TaxID=61149 RepID=A0A2P2PRT1_RHIMU
MKSDLLIPDTLCMCLSHMEIFTGLDIMKKNKRLK